MGGGALSRAGLALDAGTAGDGSASPRPARPTWSLDGPSSGIAGVPGGGRVRLVDDLRDVVHVVLVGVEMGVRRVEGDDCSIG